MSVNIRVELDVKGLTSREQAEEVRQAVHKVMSSERIDGEVALSLRESDGEFTVRGRNEWPISVSGVRYWEPQLQAQLDEAVGQVSPEAEVRLFCVDVDLERAMEEDTL